MEKLSHVQELQTNFIRLFIVTLGGSNNRYHNGNICCRAYYCQWVELSLSSHSNSSLVLLLSSCSII
jgi:hypothetical protein